APTRRRPRPAQGPQVARLRRRIRVRGSLHPGRHPVRAARAPPARRGDLDAEGNLRPDRGASYEPPPHAKRRRWRLVVSADSLGPRVEALLFLSPEPVSPAELAVAIDGSEDALAAAAEELEG